MLYRRLGLLLVLLGCGLLTTTIRADESKEKTEKKEKKEKVEKKKRVPRSVYRFKAKDIDGVDTALAKFRGQCLLIVNVASQ